MDLALSTVPPNFKRTLYTPPRPPRPIYLLCATTISTWASQPRRRSIDALLHPEGVSGSLTPLSKHAAPVRQAGKGPVGWQAPLFGCARNVTAVWFVVAASHHRRSVSSMTQPRSEQLRQFIHALRQNHPGRADPLSRIASGCKKLSSTHKTPLESSRRLSTRLGTRY